MTASSPPPESAASERPRLIINGEPFRPEDLCQSLPTAVLVRLEARFAPEAPLEEPPPSAPGAGRGWRLGVVLGVLALGLAALWLWLRSR